MRELALGQRVICKYRNTRYYHSEVTELTSATFYEVVFDDGSYSDNLFPEDIQVCGGGEEARSGVAMLAVTSSSSGSLNRRAGTLPL